MSNKSIIKIFTGLTALLAISSFTSCAKKISFLNSSIVPAARGYVKTKKDKNDNYTIQIEITNLAEVQRLQPSRQVYVAWMETDRERVKNIGQINSSSSFLSKTLKASIETVSPLKPNKIFITAEDDASIQSPGSQIVLTTDSF